MVTNIGNEIDEAKLVFNFKNGNLSDTELSYLLNHIKRYICRSHNRSFFDPDDVASEAVLKAYMGIEGLQDDANFFCWAEGIARNIILKLYRDAKRLPTQSRDGASGCSNPESPAEMQALQEAEGFNDEAWLRRTYLEEARASLSEEYQRVITLRIDEQWPSKEVAELIGKSDDNVRQMERRACRKMREFLLSKGCADMFDVARRGQKPLKASSPTKSATSLSANI